MTKKEIRNRLDKKLLNTLTMAMKYEHCHRTDSARCKISALTITTCALTLECINDNEFTNIYETIFNSNIGE